MKKTFLAVIACLFLLNPSFAGIQNIEARLQLLTASCEGRVGVAFIDLKTGIELQSNGSCEFPAASVAKVPVMCAAYHLAVQGKVDLEKKIRFRESDKLGGSGVLRWMRGNRSYTLRNLIRLMIMLSDNTATRLVINAIGTQEINNYLKEAGITKTLIADPTMLVEPPAKNRNLTTPRDMANLLTRIYSLEGFSKSAQAEMLYFMRNQRYRWGIWRGVSPGTIVADKTGNLEGILNDAGIIYSPSGDYVLSIFTCGFKKQQQARLIINAISKIVFEEYTGIKIPEPKPAKKKYYKKKKSKKSKVTKQKLSRRPSQKSKQSLGRRGAASNRKSRSSRKK